MGREPARSFSVKNSGKGSPLPSGVGMIGEKRIPVGGPGTLT